MTTDMATQLTVTQAVAYALLCAEQTESDAAWKGWAEGWLTGADRSAKAAHAAKATAATTAAQHAAFAAQLLGQATEVQTEAALLGSEGRNAKWQLDNASRLEADCLAAAAEAVRDAEVSDNSRILALAEDY